MRFILFVLILISSAVAGARPDLPKPYVVVPVLIDGAARDQIWIFPRAERKHFALEAGPLLRTLDGFINRETRDKLKNRQSSQGTISLRDLDGVGISAEFSEEKLEIKIDIPLKLRKKTDLDLTYGLDENRYRRPDQPSGYLNLRMNQAYQYGDSAASDTKLPFTGRADLVQNFGGLVFESGTEFTENTSRPWRRQDTRFVWDAEDDMLRFSAGEFDTSARGFQSSAAVAGLAVSRQFSIQPYRTARPLGNSELNIKRPSLVEIYINGVMYMQMRLGPGVFNIKDFPIVNGQNDVKVKIKDDLGQEETFNFSALYENTILLEGLHEFGYFLGRPWTDNAGDRVYDPHNGLYTFYHRYGFTDQITGGVNYQNFQSQSLLGAEVSFISRAGFFSLDAACSRASFQQKACAERLRYRSLDRILGYESKTILNLELERREIGFNPVSVNTLGSAPYESRVDAQLTRQFADYFFAGIGGTYQKSGTSLSDTRIYRANLIVPFTPRFRLEGSFAETVDTVRTQNYTLSLFWIDAPGVHSASAYYASQDASANLSLARNNIKNYDDYRLNATASKSSGVSSSNISGSYFTQAAELRAENYSSRSDLRDYNMASVGLNTSLAWVGGNFALSQPIQDSFALVTAENLPRHQTLMINPNGDSAEAQLGPFSSTVLSRYTAYYKYTLNLDSTSLPTGYLMEKEFYNIQPTYRSGILIPIRLSSKIMVKGHLYFADGTPAVFVVGDVFNSKGQLVDNNFFTNKSGVFVIEGLEPGDYLVKTDNSKLGPLPLRIQRNETNFVTVDLIASPGGTEEGGTP